MGGGRKLWVCCECWNRHVRARRAARKNELSEHKTEIRARTLAAMASAGTKIGDSVEWVATSCLGPFGPVTHLRGRIVEYRGYVRVDCGQRVSTSDGPRRFLDWHHGWRVV